MRMKLLLLLCPFLIVYSFPSKGCSCLFNKYLTVKEYNESALIFSGRVLQIDTVDHIHQKVLFSIDKLYKKQHRLAELADTVSVYITTPDSLCGMHVKLRQSWLLFTSHSAGFFTEADSMGMVINTTSCHRNVLLNDLSKMNETILNSNLFFLDQLQKNQNAEIDQYYLSQKHWNNPHADTLYAKGIIKNGYPVGTWYYYGADKSVTSEYVYSEEGILIKSVIFFENGNIQFTGEYDYDGLMISFAEYDESGVLISKSHDSVPVSGLHEEIYYEPSGIPQAIRFRP